MIDSAHGWGFFCVWPKKIESFGFFSWYIYILLSSSWPVSEAIWFLLQLIRIFLKVKIWHQGAMFVTVLFLMMTMMINLVYNMTLDLIIHLDLLIESHGSPFSLQFFCSSLDVYFSLCHSLSSLVTWEERSPKLMVS